MSKLLVHVFKEVHDWYEINQDTDDLVAVEQREEEDLRAYDYEEVLNLDWIFGSYPPAIIEIQRVDKTA